MELIDKKLVSISDHLDGIVFVDHVKEDDGKFYKSVEGKMKPWDVEKVLENKK